MQTYDEPQVKFNAGVAIAIEIANIIKRCEYFARMQRFDLWYDELQILQRRLMSKAFKDIKALNEILDAEKGFEGDPSIDNSYLEIWKRKVSKGRPINYKLSQNVYNYLSKYEVVLRKYVDKFGYGMPEKDDDEGL